MGTADLETANASVTTPEQVNASDFGKNLKILPPNDQVKELQTIIRDKYAYGYLHK